MDLLDGLKQAEIHLFHYECGVAFNMISNLIKNTLIETQALFDTLAVSNASLTVNQYDLDKLETTVV
jgi:hypothetical protein